MRQYKIPPRLSRYNALRASDCERIFEDQASGAKTDRPGLAQALAYVRSGDTLTVWKLDRFGRSMKHLIKTVTEMEGRGGGRIPLPDGKYRHDDARRPSGVSSIRSIGAARTRSDR